MTCQQDIGSLVITLRAHVPWWIRAALVAARGWLWLRLPLNVDRFTAWAARQCSVTVRT